MRLPERYYHAALEVFVRVPHVHPYAVFDDAGVVGCVEEWVHAGTVNGRDLEDVGPAEASDGDPGCEYAESEEEAPVGPGKAGAGGGGGSVGMVAEVGTKGWTKAMKGEVFGDEAET